MLQDNSDEGFPALNEDENSSKPTQLQGDQQLSPLHLATPAQLQQQPTAIRPTSLSPQSPNKPIPQTNNSSVISTSSSAPASVTTSQSSQPGSQTSHVHSLISQFAQHAQPPQYQQPPPPTTTKLIAHGHYAQTTMAPGVYPPHGQVSYFSSFFQSMYSV